jgi:hypothetical protein
MKQIADKYSFDQLHEYCTTIGNSNLSNLKNTYINGTKNQKPIYFNSLVGFAFGLESDNKITIDDYIINKIK